jgi:hypothetical protein
MESWLKAALAPISIAQAAINLRAFRFCIAISPQLELVIQSKQLEPTAPSAAMAICALFVQNPCFGLNFIDVKPFLKAKFLEIDR